LEYRPRFASASPHAIPLVVVIHVLLLLLWLLLSLLLLLLLLLLWLLLWLLLNGRGQAVQVSQCVLACVDGWRHKRRRAGGLLMHLQSLLDHTPSLAEGQAIAADLHTQSVVSYGRRPWYRRNTLPSVCYNLHYFRFVATMTGRHFLIQLLAHSP
jgi:hypothetical protein